MGVKARSRELLAKYAFLVYDISSGMQNAKFQQCTGGEVSFAIGEYAEGGAAAPMKEPTRASFSNYTLQHGVSSTNTDFYDWCKEIYDYLANVPEGTGVNSPLHLRNLEIRQLTRGRSVAKTVQIYNASPTRFSPGEFDNTSDDVQIEELEIAYEQFNVKLG